MTSRKTFKTAGAVTAVSVIALALAACTPPHPRVSRSALKSISVLDCPEDEDGLSRKSVASDGKSCVYGNDDGDRVDLQLVDVSGGDVKGALAPFEARLRGELPAATDIKSPTAAAGTDRVDIDLPGIHIHANGHDQDKNDHGSVQIGPGEPAKDADAGGGHVQISTSKPGVTIDAGDNGAQISVSEGGGGVRRYFMLASDTPGPNGYKMVAYEARGPANGPLAVALVMAKSDDHGDITDAARSLLKHNVGG